MSTEKLELLNKLKEIKDIGPENKKFGICFNSQTENDDTGMCYEAMVWMSSTWPKFSGSENYPVTYTNGPLWDNPERWELLDHCIDFLERELS